MPCGCTKKSSNPEEQAAAKSALAESRAQAVARFRVERQERLMAQQRHTMKEQAQVVLQESLDALQ